MHFRKAYFRLLVHPSRKLWPKPNSGNSVPCILPYKMGSLEFNEGAIFEQNTFSNTCLPIKMKQTPALHFWKLKKKGFMIRSKCTLMSHNSSMMQHCLHTILILYTARPTNSHFSLCLAYLW